MLIPHFLLGTGRERKREGDVSRRARCHPLFSPFLGLFGAGAAGKAQLNPIKDIIVRGFSSVFFSCFSTFDPYILFS